ncbi:MAG: hypothetical protein UR91_C0038G0007 [Candidatus Nomurabacteria bacterium GW2011_GWC2_35_8]|uniref:Uncharacterized protein n=1 Tax=Candidatus Nomurabacteria bacterium GW2011_GWC2_35_8 TaxID=1618752 RepID=A0A0G0DG62_9BACT|nr:MAG: hypothetical protein UR91_C0038G0007 [Candidatus Nomurabacteria bacterium GW2011_GWC2_35_8]
MEQEKEIKHKFVETYAEDMAKVIENDNSGLIKKIIHNEEEHEIEKINLSPESRKNKFFMFTGFVLIIIGFIVLSYFLFDKDINTVPVEQQFTPLIFNDKSIFLEIRDFKKEEIAQIVLNSVSGVDVKNGGVEGIYLISDKKIVGLRDFLSLIKGNLIPDENKILVSDNFLLGAVNGETKDFFILLKVRSITDIFDSLRAWENKMFFDLQGFFGVALSPETKYLLTKNLDDGVVENKNARILYDKDGKIVMMYVLANENSVIITNTIKSAQELMRRLASSQIKK